MSGVLKDALKYSIFFLMASFCCILLLLLICKIPQSVIRENSQKSAEILVQEEAFPLLIGNFVNSRGDNYADSNLLNVIYNVDSEHVFHSVIEAPYYRVEGESALENYYETVAEEKKPNTEYARYWHGSQIFIRPLLTVMDVEGIRLTLFALLVILNLLLAICLLRQKQFYAAGIYGFGMIAAGFWMTAASLEYIMTFLIMTAVSLVLWYVCRGEAVPDEVRNRRLTCLFITSGVLTCFLDFLTTETLTFTVPWLLYLLLSKSRKCLGTFRQEFCRMIKWGTAWLISYGMMFAVKWVMIFWVLGKAAFENALQSAALRMDGSIVAEGLSAGEAGSFTQQLSGALLRNLACLFPVTSQVEGTTVLLMVFGLLAVTGALCYLFRKDPVDFRFIGLLLITAVIPYVRFMCLSNHSYIHYFFAYRAQMVTVMAILGIVWDCIWPVNSKNNRKEARQERRKKNG